MPAIALAPPTQVQFVTPQAMALQPQSQQPVLQVQQRTSSVPVVTPTPLAPSGADSHPLEGQYEILGKIGEGTYGVVYLGASRETPRKLYAIKTFKTGRVRLVDLGVSLYDYGAELW